MTETVTDIIVARSRSQDRLTTMIVWSLGLHAAVIVGLLLAPSAASDAPKLVMSISLSGNEGVKTDGMTQAGAQPVKQQQPVEEKRPVVAPPKERPEMTIPDPKAKTRLEKPKTQVAETQPAANTAPAPTKVRGQGFGLSSTGGKGLGGVQVDPAMNFCCEEYLTQMVAAIRMKWNQQQSVAGSTGMIFTILRDGTITAVQVERSSGFAALDTESQHALLATARLQPLPAAYPNSTLTVHLRFDYER
jgi:TonB family protein